MKKITAALLLLALCVSLFACGKTETPPASDPVETPAQPEAPAEPDTPAEPEAPAQPETPAEPEAPTESKPMPAEVLPPVTASWEEPVYTIENTLENRQAAIVAECKAYYYKATMNQYGLQYLTVVKDLTGGILRGHSLEYNTPEAATKDNTQYQWCSSFAHDVVYNTFGYKLLDNHEFCRTTFLSEGKCDDPEIVIYQYNCSSSEADNKAAAEAAVAMMQPGDIVTWTRPSDNQGHTLMVVDDMNADGKLDILHRSGNRYDMSTGVDKLETKGIQVIYDISQAFLSTESAQNFLDKARFSIYRPALLDAEKYPLTRAAQARLTYPGLRVDRTLDVGSWASVPSGSVITVEVEVFNRARTTLTDMPFHESIPAGCTLVSAEGSLAADHPYWLVTLKPGYSTVLRYQLKVEGNPGETIVLHGSSHAGIASNILKLTIEAFTPDSAKLQDEAVQQTALAASANSFEFASKLYEAATGKAVSVPVPEELLETCFMPHQTATVYQPKEDTYTGVGAMILPGYFGGRRLWTMENVRVLETRIGDLQAGDIILVRPELDDASKSEAWIFDGEVLLTAKNGSVKKLNQEDLTKLLSFQFFALLRPSLVG